MSHAGVPRTVVALAALAAAASLMSCHKDAVLLVEALVPDVPTVKINFTCGTVDSVGLTDANGKSAWAVQRHPNNPITWVVPQNVTINSIVGKTEPLPIVQNPNDPHGGSPGASFQATVKSDTAFAVSQKTFGYAIDVTCTAGADTTRLLIDPEMIIKKP